MVQAQDVIIEAGGGRSIAASLALPEKTTGGAPAVLVLHEIFGLTDDIRRIAGRFADAGYVALAPDLFGAGFRPACIVRAFVQLQRRSGRAFGDIDIVRGWLGRREEVDASRIGVAGFCMGGGFALAYGVISDVGVAATFYGDVPATAADLDGVCPVVGGYGGRDRVFAGQGRRLDGLLGQLGVDHDVKIYADAGHSFMNRHQPGLVARFGAVSPMHVGYDEDAAADSWDRMLTFFGRCLDHVS